MFLQSAKAYFKMTSQHTYKYVYFNRNYQLTSTHLSFTLLRRKELLKSELMLQLSASCQSRAMIAAEGTCESPQRCLMNRPIGVHRAGDKASVGLVRPSATGLDRGHGSLSGFTPLLLCKHSEPSDWSGTPSNQRPPEPLRTIAAGSASARSFIGSPARIFYMNQRASYAFFPWFLRFLRALLQTIKM